MKSKYVKQYLKDFIESLFLEDFVKFKSICNNKINIKDKCDNEFVNLSFTKTTQIIDDKYSKIYSMVFFHQIRKIIRVFKLSLVLFYKDGVNLNHHITWSIGDKILFINEKNKNDLDTICSNIYYTFDKKGTIRLNTMLLEMEISRV